RTSASALTVISRALGERARALGVAPERIHRLPGGVDPERWRPRPTARARERLGLPRGRPILLFSGFVHYDIALVAEAFARVLAPAEPAAMARAVLDLLADPARRERLGARSREFVATRLSYAILAGPLERLYRTLAAGTGAREAGLETDGTNTLTEGAAET